LIYIFVLETIRYSLFCLKGDRLREKEPAVLSLGFAKDSSLPYKQEGLKGNMGSL